MKLSILITLGVLVSQNTLAEAPATQIPQWLWGATIKKAVTHSVTSNQTSSQSIMLAHQKSSNKLKHRAGFPKRRYATGRKVFIFDPKRLRWAAYDHQGRLVSSGRASGGRHYCPDVKRRCLTPRGVFRVHRKGNAYCKSSKYPLGRGGAPMPYCMFFYRGYAIHGSPDVPNYNASHGCIRVLPEAARWLHYNFIDYGTTVIVQPY